MLQDAFFHRRRSDVYMLTTMGPIIYYYFFDGRSPSNEFYFLIMEIFLQWNNWLGSISTTKISKGKCKFVKKKRWKEIDFFLFRFRLKRRHQRYCIIIKIAVNYCFTSQWANIGTFKKFFFLLLLKFFYMQYLQSTYIWEE